MCARPRVVEYRFAVAAVELGRESSTRRMPDCGPVRASNAGTSRLRNDGKGNDAKPPVRRLGERRCQRAAASGPFHIASTALQCAAGSQYFGSP